MAKDYGTYNWATRTGGSITLRDKLSIMAQGTLARAASKKRSKLAEKIRFLEVEDILPPDSAITRAAAALSQDACKAYLFNHNMRSYFWARLLDDGQRRFDDEALYVVMLLHDLGLTDKYRLNGSEEQCFTLSGSRAAERLAYEHEWSDKRAALMSDAISLHINVVIDDGYGREAQLARIGSGADVAGIGLDVLHGNQIDEVVQKFPRHNLKKEIKQVMDREIVVRPCCRMSFMYRRLGFGDMIANSLFAE